MTIPDIRASTEALESLVTWLVRTWRDKNRVRLLLLLDSVLLAVVVALPKALPAATEFPPPGYGVISGSVIGLIFLAALVAALRKAPGAGPPPPLHSIIKGLRPFERGDAEHFQRLELRRILADCGVAVTAADFRFGVLYGDSGTGKTSVLQAGLGPYLATRGHVPVYVKFTDRDPVQTVRDALREVPGPEEGDGAELDALLRGVAKRAPGPVVLLFDQFEQLFIHRKTRAERAEFVAALGRWYAEPGGGVKILVSIRGDFANRMVELQKVMGYSLGPQDSFLLEKFEPSEAVEVLRVIAEAERMDFDADFVGRLVHRDLAGREDGLVSPVEIQVLSWMIAAERDPSKRAFRREAFERVGGLAGVMERFLERALATRETPTRRQAALKVLLALTDFERSARARVRTIPELQEAVGDLSGSDVAEAVEWLARADVRLLSPVDRGEGVTGYELAHERIIPALRRIAGKELTDVERANQLLDRRVGEWVVNGQSKHYLLRWRELRLIQGQSQYLDWSNQREQKDLLLARSRKRLQHRLAVMGLVLILGAGAGAWTWSPQGQRHQVYQRFQALVDVGVVGPEGMMAGYAIAGEYGRALRATDSLPDEKRIRLRLELARVQAAVEGLSAARPLLAQIREEALGLKDASDRTSALLMLSATVHGLEGPGPARALLKEAEAELWRISEPRKLVTAGVELSSQAARMGAREEALRVAERLWPAATEDRLRMNVLQNASSLAGLLRDPRFLDLLPGRLAEIEDSDPVHSIWSHAVFVCAEICDREQLRAWLERPRPRLDPLTPGSSDLEAIRALAAAGRKLRDPALLRRAEEIARARFGNGAYSPRVPNATVLTAVLDAEKEIHGRGRADALLREIALSKPRNPGIVVAHLAGLAEVAGRRGSTALVHELLDRATAVADSSEAPGYVYATIALSSANIALAGGDSEFLRQARSILPRLDSGSRHQVLARTAAVAFARGDYDQWLGDLQESLDLALGESDFEAANSYYADMAVGNAYQGHWRAARVAAERIGSDEEEVELLLDLLYIHAAKSHPDLVLEPDGTGLLEPLNGWEEPLTTTTLVWNALGESGPERTAQVQPPPAR